MIKTPLLTERGRHPKINKNMKVQVDGRIMHFAPAEDSGYNVCPMSTAGCREACLNTAGYAYKGRNSKQAARIRRTKWFFDDRDGFMDKLAREIHRSEKYANERGLICGIRLNGTSDIVWENVPVHGSDNLMSIFPEVKFYDYTKRHNRKNLPDNYRLTFSRSENNIADCMVALKNGMNVAVVFYPYIPNRYILLKDWEHQVIDGDEHDWRYDDPKGVVVGLKAKGKARHDMSGFTVRL